MLLFGSRGAVDRMPVSAHCAHPVEPCSTGSGATRQGTGWHRVTSSPPMWPRRTGSRAPSPGRALRPAVDAGENGAARRQEPPRRPGALEHKHGDSGVRAAGGTPPAWNTFSTASARSRRGSASVGARRASGSWRERLAADLGDGPRIAGAAVIAGPAPGLIAGIEILEMTWRPRDRGGSVDDLHRSGQLTGTVRPARSSASMGGIAVRCRHNNPCGAARRTRLPRCRRARPPAQARSGRLVAPGRR